MTINKANIEGVNFSDAQKVYNGAEQAITNTVYTTLDTQYGDDITSYSIVYYSNSARTVSVLDANVVNVNVYYARLTVAAGDNYNTLTLDATFTITPRQVSVSWSIPDDLIYNGSARTASVALGNLVSGETGLFTYSVTGDTSSAAIAYSGTTATVTYSATDAGDYSVAFALIGTNYVLETGAETENVFAIGRKELTLSADTTRYYDGTTEVAVTNVTGLVGSETLSTVASFNSKVVGAKVVTVIVSNGTNGGKASNYVLSQINSATPTENSANTYTTNGQIDKKSLAIEVRTIRDYDATTNVAVGLKVYGTGDDVYTDLVSGDDISLSAEYASANAGVGINIVVTLSGNDAENYTLNIYNMDTGSQITVGFDNDSAPYVKTLSGNGRIDPKEITLTVTKGNDFTYDATNHNSFTLTPSGIISGQTLTFSYSFDGVNYTNQAIAYDGSCNVAIKYADSYTLTVSETLGNYSSYLASNYSLIVLGNSQTVVVSKKTIAVTWTAADTATSVGLRGSDPTFSAIYNGNQWTLTGSFASTDICAADESYVTVTELEKTIVDVGTVNATAVLADIEGSLSNNYELTNDSASLTITQREVSLSWTLDGVAQGYVVYSKSGHTVAATAGNLVTNAGTQEQDVISVTVGGNSSATNAGNYTATASGLTGTKAGNYKLPAVASFDWSIYAKGVTITVTYTKEYDGTTDAGFTAEGAVSGDTLDISASYADASVGVNKTISYTMTDANYTFGAAANVDYRSGSGNVSGGEITRRALTITWTNNSPFTYNKTAYGVMVSIGNIVSVSGDSVSFAHSTTGTASKTTFTAADNTAWYTAVNVGTYRVEFTAVNNPNYKFADNSVLVQQWTIDPIVLGVTWTSSNQDTSDFTFTYKATEHSVSAAIDGTIITGDTVTLSLASDSATIAGSTAKATNVLISAGNVVAYNVTSSLTGADAGNYELNSTKDKSFIINKADIYGGSVSLGITNGTATYDGNGHEVTINATMSGSDYITQYYGVGSDSATVAISCLYYTDSARTILTTAANSGASTNGGAPKWNGTYYAVVTATASTYNYNVRTDSTHTVTIYQAELSIAWSNYGGVTPATYDGTEQGKIATISGIATGEYDTVTFTTTADSGVTVVYSEGVYAFTAIDATDTSYSFEITGFDQNPHSNYKWATSQTYAGSFSISRRALTITFEGDDEYTYAKTAYGKTVSAEGLVSGESINIAILSYTDGIRLDGAAVTNPFLLSSETRTRSFTAINANDSYSVVLGEVTQGLNTKLSNYTITKADSTGWSIARKTLSATWAVSTVDNGGAEQSVSGTIWTNTYDARTWTPALTISALEKCTGDDVTPSVSYSGSIKYAGEYEITGVLSGSDAGNYALDVAGITIQITQRVLSFVWVTDGDANWNTTTFSRDYDANTHHVYVNFTNLQSSGDTLEGTYTNNAKRNAGNYTAQLIGITGGDCAGSYTLDGTTDPLSKNFTINKVDFNNGGDADLAISTPDSLVYNAETKTITMNHNQTRLGDSYTYVLSYYDAENSEWVSLAANTDYEIINAGAYSIRATVSNENYNTPVSPFTASFTIAKATLTGFAMEGETVVYNKDAKTLSVTNENGKTAGDLEKTQYYALDTTTVTVSYKYYTNSARTSETSTANGAASNGAAPKNVGTYYVRATITPSDEDNYNELVLDEVLIVDPKEVTISWLLNGETVADKVYNGTTYTLSYSPIGVCTGDDLAITATGSSGGKNVGEYSLTLTSGNDNYRIISGAASSFSISRRELHVSAAAYNESGYANELTFVNGAGSVEYDKKAHGVSLTVADVVSGDSVTVTVVGGGLDGANVVIEDSDSGNAGYYYVTNVGDSYSISVATGEIGLNYYIGTALLREWEITKTDFTNISATNKSEAYSAVPKTVDVDWGDFESYNSQLGDAVAVSFLYYSDATYQTSVAAQNVKNVGTYYVEATFTSDNYNDLVIGSASEPLTVVIIAAAITGVSLQDGITKVYDGTNVNAVAINENEENGTQYVALDGATVTVTYTYYPTATDRTQGTNALTDYKNVGTYYVKAVVTSTSNYRNDLTLETTCTVTTRELSVSIVYTSGETGVFVYDGLTHGLASLTISNYAEDESLTEIITIPAGVNDSYLATNANSYTITIAIADKTVGNVTYLASNYTLSAYEASFTITPVYVVGSWRSLADEDEDGEYDELDDGIAQFTYNKSEQGVIFVPYAYYDYQNNLLSGHTGTLSFYYKSDEGYGDRATDATLAVLIAEIETILINGNATTNYVLKEGVSDSQEWIINKANVTGFSFSGRTITYSGVAQSLTVTGTTALGDGVEAFDVTYYYYSAYTDETTNTLTSSVNGATTVGGAPKNVLKNGSGEVIAYKVIAVVEESRNYNEYRFSAQDLTITKATITGITMTDVVVVYDGLFHTLSVSGGTTSLGDVVDVAYTITLDGIAAAGNSAKDVLWDNDTVAARIVTATVTSYNYEDLFLQSTLKITPLYVVGSWKKNLNGDALTLSDGVAQYTYNASAQGVVFVPQRYYEDSACTITVNVAPDSITAQYLDNGADVRANATGVYLVNGVMTSMSARVSGFVANDMPTNNYVLASGYEDQDWIINRRDVSVTFNNMVQSWTQNDWVTPTLASSSFVVDDSGVTAAQVTAMDTEVAALLTAETYSITTSTYPNDAASRTFTAYRVNVDDVVSATLGNNFNLVSSQYFVVSALALSDTNNDFHFAVATRAELETMRTESAALNNLEISSSLVVYKQTADISGVADGAYKVYDGAVVNVLYGSYNGNGYMLSDFTVIGSGANVGFFGSVSGSLTGVKLRNVTVISTGANASVGAIAGTANAIASSSAQGYVYVKSASTVGFLAGTTTGAVSGSTAVGYVKVLGTATVEVKVGGAVGSANDDVSADAFVEINNLNANATVRASGIVAEDGENEITVEGSFLAGSLSGASSTVATGTSSEYAAYMTANATIRSIVVGYVMKNYYVGDIDTTAQNFEKYTIYNYRQLSIVEMYSWATYTLGADIYLPYSYGNGVHAGEYAYGTIVGSTGENAKKIYSSAAGTFMGVTEEVR